jgi:hypothetical protein
MGELKTMGPTKRTNVVSRLPTDGLRGFFQIGSLLAGTTTRPMTIVAGELDSQLINRHACFKRYRTLERDTLWCKRSCRPGVGIAHGC